MVTGYPKHIPCAEHGFISLASPNIGSFSPPLKILKLGLELDRKGPLRENRKKLGKGKQEESFGLALHRPNPGRAILASSGETERFVLHVTPHAKISMFQITTFRRYVKSILPMMSS